MEIRHTDYLDLAAGAVSRRDYLSAMQYGMRAAGAPEEMNHLRCDAQMLLAVVSLELGAAEAALAYAVGAHLGACRAKDEDRAEKAAALVAVVVAKHPHLGEGTLLPAH